MPLEPLANDPLRISEVRRLMHNNTLLGHPNVIVTPHIAFNSHEALERINRSTVDNINGYLSGGAIDQPAAPKPATRRAKRAPKG